MLQERQTSSRDGEMNERWTNLDEGMKSESGINLIRWMGRQVDALCDGPNCTYIPQLGQVRGCGVGERRD